MSEPLKLAVFDCDGTLVDSQGAIVRTMAAAFAAWNLPEPEPAKVRRVVGLPLVEAISRLWPDGDIQACAALSETYKENFGGLRRADAVEEPLFPHAVEALTALRDDGWLLGIATGKSRRGLVNTLEGHGLLDRFITVQTADTGPGKPAPDMLLRAIAEVGGDARRTVMVGDTTYDIHMARSARVAALGVSWGYHETQELIDAGAFRVLDDYRDLRNVLRSVWETA